MPWSESSVMDERLRFVARLLEGEQMASLCREFSISRKTGYKIFDRYKSKQPVAHKEFNCGEPWRLCGFRGKS